MTHETDNNPSTPDKLKSGWVWRCTDDSIAAGQISILAIFETVVAVGVYWWLALQFEWPWMAFVSMIAAPILLLRSKESIALGVRLLRTYWKTDKTDISRQDKLIIFSVTALVTGIAIYWLATHWLVDYLGWSLFWRAALLGAGAFAVAVAVAFAVAGAGAGAGSVAGSGAVSGAVVVVVVATLYKNNLLASFFFATFIAPFFAFGILIRGLIIRLYATMRHPLAGLTQLPQNWRETLLIIDCTHPPELLPQAGTVSSELSVKGVWADRHNQKGADWLFIPILIIAWYFPALAYRWSLKASAWLWFPLALALTPPLHRKKAQDSRRWMAVLHAWHWSYWIIATVGILWLLSATPWLETWLPLLPIPTEYTTVYANLPAPPTFGLRYMLACLGCLLILALIVKSKNLKASHGLILESPNELNILTPQDQAEFLSIAKSIDRTRLLLIATLVLWGEMMVLGFMHAHYPDVVERFISPALLLYL